MKANKDYLFTLELRIHKQIIKINVHEADSLNDLFLKLAGKVHVKQKHSEVLRQKLEAGLKRMTDSPNCSQKVKNKLEALTEQTKIVILGVTQDEGTNRSLNETPFNILAETSLNMHRHYNHQNKRNYLSQHSTAHLNWNYNRTAQIIYQNQEAENNELYFKYHTNDDNLYSLRPHIHNFQMQNNSNQRYQAAFNRKEHPDIVINTKPTISNRDNQYIYKSQFDLMTAQYGKNDANLRNYHQQSFQDYKSQKKQSQTVSRQQSAQNLRRRKHSSNHMDIAIPKNYNHLSYNPSQFMPTAINTAKFGPANGIATKKFSYLQEFNV